MTAPINHKIVLLGQSPGTTAAFAGFVSTSTGVFTSAATSGLQIYNTADRTTNYERLAIFWSSNFATISSAAAGTGTVRRMVLATTFGQQFFFNVTNGSNGQFQFSGASTSSAGSTLAAFIGTNTAASGTTEYLAIRPTYNQSTGTAANTDLLVNRTETAVGSGVQRLMDLQVGGVSKFAVNNVGVFMIPDGVTAPSALAGYVRFYVDTADGDLKVIFGDGVVKTLATDT